MPRETRERILHAALKRFADSDSRGVSLRAIAREAGVNSALIQYHFRNRDGLFEAVVLQGLIPIQERRQRLLETLRTRPSGSEGSLDTARGLVRLIVEPLMLPPNGDPDWHAMNLRVLARARADHRILVEKLSLEHFGGLLIAMADLLRRVLPNTSEFDRQRRLRFCVHMALETIAGPEGQLTDSVADRDTAQNRLAEDMIHFLAGGLEAKA